MKRYIITRSETRVRSIITSTVIVYNLIDRANYIIVYQSVNDRINRLITLPAIDTDREYLKQFKMELIAEYNELRPAIHQFLTQLIIDNL